MTIIVIIVSTIINNIPFFIAVVIMVIYSLRSYMFLDFCCLTSLLLYILITLGSTWL